MNVSLAFLIVVFVVPFELLGRLGVLVPFAFRRLVLALGLVRGIIVIVHGTRGGVIVRELEREFLGNLVEGSGCHETSLAVRRPARRCPSVQTPAAVVYGAA